MKDLNVKIKKDILFYSLDYCNEEGIEDFKTTFMINDEDFKKYFYINNNDICVKKGIKCNFYEDDNLEWPSLIFNDDCEIDITIDENNFNEYFKII